jgi:hypothetical protein
MMYWPWMRATKCEPAHTLSRKSWRTLRSALADLATYAASPRYHVQVLEQQVGHIRGVNIPKLQDIDAMLH